MRFSCKYRYSFFALILVRIPCRSIIQLVTYRYSYLNFKCFLFTAQLTDPVDTRQVLQPVESNEGDPDGPSPTPPQVGCASSDI